MLLMVLRDDIVYSPSSSSDQFDYPHIFPSLPHYLSKIGCDAGEKKLYIISRMSMTLDTLVGKYEW